MENRLELTAPDRDDVAQWPHAADLAGLRWERHADRMPEARLIALQRQISALLADVPLGTLDLPPMRFEMPGLRAWYEDMDRRGGAHLAVLLLEGEHLVAMSDADWDTGFPDRVWQKVTTVARDLAEADRGGAGLARPRPQARGQGRVAAAAAARTTAAGAADDHGQCRGQCADAVDQCPAGVAGAAPGGQLSAAV